MSNDTPTILVCNDDGINAAGILALAAAVEDLGRVVVVAPAEEQSAVGHAITMRRPVRLRKHLFPTPAGEIEAYAVTGTPADCIKIAIDKLLDRPPDLVVSGINHGPNTAVNVLYSGTVSAATEAAILGVDAVAFSLCSWSPTDFEPAAHVARGVIQRVLQDGLPRGILLNVNIPDLPTDRLRGVLITRQARSRWEEEFEERTDPHNERYYWLTGRFVNLDEGTGTDLQAIDSGYVSITPLQHDLTAHHLLEGLDGLAWDPAY